MAVSAQRKRKFDASLYHRISKYSAPLRASPLSPYPMDMAWYLAAQKRSVYGEPPNYYVKEWHIQCRCNWDLLFVKWAASPELAYGPDNLYTLVKEFIERGTLTAIDDINYTWSIQGARSALCRRRGYYYNACEYNNVKEEANRLLTQGAPYYYHVPYLAMLWCYCCHRDGGGSFSGTYFFLRDYDKKKLL